MTVVQSKIPWCIMPEPSTVWTEEEKQNTSTGTAAVDLPSWIYFFKYLLTTRAVFVTYCTWCYYLQNKLKWPFIQSQPMNWQRRCKKLCRWDWKMAQNCVYTGVNLWSLMLNWEFMHFSGIPYNKSHTNMLKTKRYVWCVLETALYQCSRECF